MSTSRMVVGLTAALALGFSLAGPATAYEELPQLQYLLTASEAQQATGSVPLTQDVRECWQQTLNFGGDAILCVAGFSWQGKSGTKSYPRAANFKVFSSNANAQVNFTKDDVPRRKAGFGLLGKALVVKETKSMVVFIYNKPTSSQPVPLQGYTARVVNNVLVNAECIHSGVYVSKKPKKVTAKQRQELTQCLAKTLNAQVQKLANSSSGQPVSVE
jgi:hypothetical protein